VAKGWTLKWLKDHRCENNAETVKWEFIGTEKTVRESACDNYAVYETVQNARLMFRSCHLITVSWAKYDFYGVRLNVTEASNNASFKKQEVRLPLLLVEPELPSSRTTTFSWLPNVTVIIPVPSSSRRPESQTLTQASILRDFLVFSAPPLPPDRAGTA
jgi:hypothetical protein